MPLVSFAALTPVAWANGAGTTVELVSREASTGLTSEGTQWRLSIATLQRPAAFSPLPGMQRQFMPVGGSVVLTIDGARVPVAEGTVCAFDGAADVELVSLTNECNAVNLMIAADPATKPSTHAQAPVSAYAYAAPLTLSRIAPNDETPGDLLVTLPLTHTNGANQFDVIRPTDTANYLAARTGLCAAIAKSGCQSAALPRTAS